MQRYFFIGLEAATVEEPMEPQEMEGITGISLVPWLLGGREKSLGYIGRSLVPWFLREGGQGEEPQWEATLVLASYPDS